MLQRCSSVTYVLAVGHGLAILPRTAQCAALDGTTQWREDSAGQIGGRFWHFHSGVLHRLAQHYVTGTTFSSTTGLRVARS